jgi:outer membrane protein assembly factor BamE (lipoprotein component of BamABCDE complex)
MEPKRHSRTSRLVTAAVLVLLIFLFSGCATSSSYSPAAAPTFDKLIVPGKRIGPIALGMPQPDVVKILGKPGPSSVISAERGTHSIYHYLPDLTVFIKSDSNRVYKISAVSPEYATADGIRVGMTEPEVRAKRGKPKDSFQHNENNVSYWYKSLQIGFDPSRGYSIFAITVTE